MAFDQTKSEVQAVVIKFPVGDSRSLFRRAREPTSLIPKLNSLQNSSAALHQKLRFEVIGHSDATGAEGTNQSLSQRRADRVAWELIQLGVPDASLHARGVATAEPVRNEDTEENRQFNRSVTFVVRAIPSPQP